MIGSIRIDCAEHPGIIGSNDELHLMHSDSSIELAWQDALNVERNLRSSGRLNISLSLPIKLVAVRRDKNLEPTSSALSRSTTNVSSSGYSVITQLC